MKRPVNTDNSRDEDLRFQVTKLAGPSTHAGQRHGDPYQANEHIACFVPFLDPRQVSDELLGGGSRGGCGFVAGLFSTALNGPVGCRTARA
jgi:hypothetical protein